MDEAETCQEQILCNQVLLSVLRYQQCNNEALAYIIYLTLYSLFMMVRNLILHTLSCFVVEMFITLVKTTNFISRKYQLMG